MNGMPLEPIFEITVDYTKTLAEMIAAGNYDWVSKDIIQEHFPISGNGKVKRKIVLFHFYHHVCQIFSKDAIIEMKKAGYEPGDMTDLLALGEFQPELHRQFPIVALGSVWQDSYGNRYVPYLSRYAAAKSCLCSRCFGGGWLDYYHFVAVCNV